MLQSVVALGVISLVWVLVGFSLAFGDRHRRASIGNPLTFFMFDGVGEATAPGALAATIPLLVFSMFQLKFAIITPALITGSFAERVRFSAYLLFMVLFSLFIYCPLAHWTWHPEGFLRKWGVQGLRRRHGRPHVGRVRGAGRGDGPGPAQESTWPRRRTCPANVPFVLLGTGMLWFGWFGFNAGSALAANGTAALAFATTNTASAAAMLGWMFFDWMRGRSRRRWGPASARWSAWWRSRPRPASSPSARASSSAWSPASISNLAVHWRTQVDARRHARRLPLPRRRRHGRA